VNWPEIQSQLLVGQTAFDRPDVVVQVFRARTQALVNNIKLGKYFGHRLVVYMIYVYEYQWRGLPHFHMCVRLTDVPDTSDIEASVVFIDQHVSAEMPIGDTDDDVKLRGIINDHMCHKCAVAQNGCKRTANDRCKRGYGTGQLIPETYIDERGFPVYRRRTENDLHVVPHNPLMTLDWGGHINCEFSTNVRRVMYTYKYLYKVLDVLHVLETVHD